MSLSLHPQAKVVQSERRAKFLTSIVQTLTTSRKWRWFAHLWQNLRAFGFVRWPVEVGHDLRVRMVLQGMVALVEDKQSQLLNVEISVHEHVEHHLRKRMAVNGWRS